MSKVAFLGDIHLQANEPLLVQQKTDAINSFVKYCMQRKGEIDYVILLGDIFHNINPPSWIKDAFWKALQPLIGEFPIHFVLGNHDIGSKSINLKSEIDSLGNKNNVFFKNEIYEIEDSGMIIAPYAFNKEEIEMAPILVTHNGFEQGLVGHYDLPLKDPKYSYKDCQRYGMVVSGHYHKPQEYFLGNTKIVFVGSVAVVDFAERDEEKRFIVLDTDTLEYESILFENNKKWIQIIISEEEDPFEVLEQSDFENAVVKLSYYGTKRWYQSLNRDEINRLVGEKAYYVKPPDTHLTDVISKKADRKFLESSPEDQIRLFADENDAQDVKEIGLEIYKKASTE